MRRTFVDAAVTVIDFMLKMQKVKDSRIMDLRCTAGNTLKADCGRGRGCPSLPVNEVDHVRLLLCGPVYLPLWTLAILSTPPPSPPPLRWAHSTQRLRLLDLSEIWPPDSWLLPPQAPANLSPRHWVSIWKVRRDRRGGRGWAVVKYWHGNRYHCGAVQLQRDQTPTLLLPPPHILTVRVWCIRLFSFFCFVLSSVAFFFFFYFPL